MKAAQPLPYTLRNDHTSWSIMCNGKAIAERLTMLEAVRLLKIANAPHMPMGKQTRFSAMRGK